MSLNKVLNRPLFRQQALRKGALKPVKARIGQMIGPSVGGSTAYNPMRVPTVVPQPGFFSRAGQFLKRTGRDIRSFPGSVPGQVMNPKRAFDLKTRVPFGMGGGISRLLVAPIGTYDAVSALTDKIGMKPGMLKTGVDFGLSGLALLNPYTRAAGLAYGAFNLARPLVGGAIDYVTQKPIGTTSKALDVRNYLGEPIQTDLFSPIDTSKRLTRKERRDLRKQESIAKAEGSEGQIQPDALKQPDNSIVVNNQPIGDLNEIVTNAATPRDPDITMRGDPEANLDMQMKPEAPVEEPGEKKSTAQLEKEALDLRAGRTPGTDATLALAREYFNELNEGQPPSQARNVFLSTLAAGLMSGTTRKQGLGGALEVLGQALGPAMNNYATLALKEGELRQKNREASLNAALNHMKALNTAAKSPDRTGGVIQYRTPDGELRNTVGFQLKDGTVQRPVVIDGRQAFVTVPQGGPITDAQGNVIGVFQQFREQKDINKRLFDIEDVLGNRYTAYSTTLDVLKTLNQLTPEGETVKAGAPVTVDAFIRRTTGVAKELLGIEIGETTADAEKKLQQFYDDEVRAIERDPDLSEEEKKEEIANILNKDGLIKEAKKRLKKNTGWFSGLSREEQEKLAVQEVSLIYALANTFKDQDRLTQRDINAAREIVNIFSLSRSSKDVKASIEAIGNQLAADIKRQERLFTNAGGLYSTILDLRQLKNFTAGSVGEITPSLEKAFTEKEIRETLEDVNL